MRSTIRSIVLVAAAALVAAGSARADDGTVKISVVAILASETHSNVAEELKDIAVEIQKKNPKLTGFTLERTTCKAMKVGTKDSFHVVDMEFAEVKVRVKDDVQKLVSLSVKPPTLGEIEYTTCCGKCFPVITEYRTKDKGELLIIAVMVKPCTKK